MNTESAGPIYYIFFLDFLEEGKLLIVNVHDKFKKLISYTSKMTGLPKNKIFAVIDGRIVSENDTFESIMESNSSPIHLYQIAE